MMKNLKVDWQLWEWKNQNKYNLFFFFNRTLLVNHVLEFSWQNSFVFLTIRWLIETKTDRLKNNNNNDKTPAWFSSLENRCYYLKTDRIWSGVPYCCRSRTSSPRCQRAPCATGTASRPQHPASRLWLSTHTSQHSCLRRTPPRTTSICQRKAGRSVWVAVPVVRQRL